MALTDRQKDFLLRLAALCDEFRAEFGYTNNDDGIHIELDGAEVFADFLSGNAGEALRTAVLEDRTAHER